MNNIIKIIDDFFVWISANYNNNIYMAGTRLAGVLCSFADIAMIWMFLRLCDEISGKVSRRRYMTLKIFAVLTLSLLFVEKSIIFFPLQGFVLSAPYFILVWTAVSEAKSLINHMKRVIREKF
ncbi:MAG: hypothetical protein IJQ56_08820, partial [Synergistaceae bacterium]|nr:hypothetical protein [Synergistaceae bacterium]MBR0204452.1 hypothetical protein [Synergistaceae bacterium]